MKWSDQVASKGGGPQSIPTLLELHKKRWAEWENYMNMLKGVGFEEQRRDDIDWSKKRASSPGIVWSMNSWEF